MRSILLLVAPIAIAAIILAAAGKQGTSVFKKQGVAWGLTLLMVFAAIGIGYAKSPINNPAPSPDYPAETVPPASAGSYVRDDANVLSEQTVRTLDQRNQRLWEQHRVTIGVVTCNYGRDDLYQYAAKRLEEMGLGGYDMIVVLDIWGDNYWLYTGDDVAWHFSDEDCSDYVYDYMEDYFARGMYDDAVLNLTEALEDWYADYYD